jgi:hypothetical protein
MADHTLQEGDYRSRFRDFQAVEIRREALVQASPYTVPDRQTSSQYATGGPRNVRHNQSTA